MKLLEPGAVVDGFVVRECIHAGGMAHIYRVEYASGAPDPGFPMAMKIPRMTAGDGAENIVGFEVELQILPALTGPHVPRFVAAGDLHRLPYITMEYLQGHTLQHWLDASERPDEELIARLGTALAHAVHSLHQQNACHLDLKPGNVLFTHEDHAVLLDFGLSWHAHFPDLLAEEQRKAVGSPAWMAPAPPRKHRPDLAPWLQEIILRCLEPEAARRYPSAAHLALDLANPTQVRITERGHRTQGTPFRTHFKRWLRAAGMHYQPSPLPSRQIEETPIVMVAVPHSDVTDATLYSLREAVARSLGIRPGARLACVTVLSPSASSTSDSARSETALHRQHHARLRQWAQPLDLTEHPVSYHVLESSDVAHALVRYAEGNHVNMMILGAATHGLQTQRFIATVPMRVARDAPCTVILVKQSLPFARLAGAS